MPPPRGEVGGSWPRTNGGHHGGELLCGEGPAERACEESGDGRRGGAHPATGLGNPVRSLTEGALGKPSPALHSSQVPSRVCNDGDGRKISSWTSHKVGHGPSQRRALDEKPGRSRRQRRSQGRRAGGIKEEGGGFSSYGSGSQGQEAYREQFQLFSKTAQEEGQKGKEEEEKKGSRRRRRKSGWEETCPSRLEGAQGPLRGDGARPKGEGKASSCQESSTLRIQEQEIEGVFRQQQFHIIQVFGDGRGGTGGALFGNIQGEDGSGSLSRGFGTGESSLDARGFVGQAGRGVGKPGGAAHGDDVLSPAGVREGEPSCSTRAGDLGNLCRPTAERKGSECCRRDTAALQVDRGDSRGYTLVSSPADGGPAGRYGPGCSEGRNPERSEGQLRGFENDVVSQPSQQREGRERERKRRKGSKRKRRSRSRRRREERSEGRQRRRQEVEVRREEPVPYEVSGDRPATDVVAGGTPVVVSGVASVTDSPVEYPIGEKRMLPDTGFKSQCQDFRPRAMDAGAVSSGSAAAGELGIPPTSGKKNLDSAFCGVNGNFLELDLCGLGKVVLQKFLEVIPLRGKPMGKGNSDLVFPLPTSRALLHSIFPDLSEGLLSWLICTTLGLNSLWGCTCFSDEPVSPVQMKCLELLVCDVVRLGTLDGKIEPFNWKNFFLTRSVDYQGDEVKIAMFFRWENIMPALPDEIGRVPLEKVCTLGARHYVENFDLFIKDRSEWVLGRSPKVMVRDEDWGAVCAGLVKKGVCTFLTREEVFDTGQGPLLNGLFGVTKDEVVDGVDVYRLIMNLIPLNGICMALSGDVATLPSWSAMSPYFIQPTESLLVSSEDVRCFFYTMSVPEEWRKYLAFNKAVPDAVLPEDLQGEQVYLASRVLPMGFLNSVSLAQHVHRNLVLSSGDGSSPVNRPEEELRKDKQFSDGCKNWRVYLDNYDLLEKVQSTAVSGLEGTAAPPVLALREQYEIWEVPRNLKKAVSRSTRAEVQGAIMDGDAGLAFPREVKLLKYLSAGIKVCGQSHVTQRQLQVVCGGLVYLCMFRRPLLGSLNAVCRQIESFNVAKVTYLPLWPECRFEIIRILGLTALVRMNFRAELHPQVTCSDASTTGGGICASSGLTVFGDLASMGFLRGHNPEDRKEHRVLVVSLFDGIGALRVALDLLEVDVVGYVSVEKDARAKRVVESYIFPRQSSWTMWKRLTMQWSVGG